jgi:hypothetical protein
MPKKVVQPPKPKKVAAVKRPVQPTNKPKTVHKSHSQPQLKKHYPGKVNHSSVYGSKSANRDSDFEP